MLKISLLELLQKIYVEVITDQNREQIAENTEQKEIQNKKSQESPKILKYICNMSALMLKE